MACGAHLRPEVGPDSQRILSHAVAHLPCRSLTIRMNTPLQPVCRLDHLVICAQDLLQGADWFEQISDGLEVLGLAGFADIRTGESAIHAKLRVGNRHFVL